MTRFKKAEKKETVITLLVIVCISWLLTYLTNFTLTLTAKKK